MAVVVADYDPRWPDRFEQLRAVISGALGPAAIAVEHVGSTAVPGLAAKPIIDVDVALADYSSAHELRPALEAAGFRRNLAGDFGDRQWYTLDEAGRRICHLSLTYLDSPTWSAHLALRDRLRADPDAAGEYGALKRRLAVTAPSADAYMDARTDVIRRLSGHGPGTAPRRPIPRRFLFVSVLVVLAALALTGGYAFLSNLSETSRGPDGLPDHRPVRASDLALRPEGRLFYPGSATVTSVGTDQSANPGDPASPPAKVETLLATEATPAEVRTWYEQHLAAYGWRPVAPIVGDVPAGGAAFEWRRGSREYFNLTLYLDRTALGTTEYAVTGLLYRVVYLVAIVR